MAWFQSSPRITNGIEVPALAAKPLALLFTSSDQAAAAPNGVFQGGLATILTQPACFLAELVLALAANGQVGEPIFDLSHGWVQKRSFMARSLYHKVETAAMPSTRKACADDDRQSEGLRDRATGANLCVS